jgi:hypothetical protein
MRNYNLLTFPQLLLGERAQDFSEEKIRILCGEKVGAGN